MPAGPAFASRLRWASTSHRSTSPVLHALRPLCAALPLGLVCACTTYPQRTEQAYAAFEAGQLDEAAKLYAKPSTTGSPFLTGVETGSVAFAAGDWDGALAHFSSAHATVKELEDRALISVADAGESLLTWVVNEGMSSYRGEGFERVMLHAFMGLCYLARGELQGAGVEARLANRLLETEEDLYQKKYAAGGLGHFLSAIVYELFDEPDNAYIDYKRMLEKDVGVELAGRAALRLSKQLGFGDEQQQWEARFGVDAGRPDGAASIVLIAGVGEGPYKEEITLPIPTGDGILQWSVPTLADRPQRVSAVELSLEGSSSGVRTDVIENVYTVTKENLDDRIAWLALKSAVRGVLKRELTQQLEEQGGGFGALIGTFFTLATERADLRAWQTLPNTWQAARVFVSPGEHSLRLQAIGGENIGLGRHEFAPGETVFILVRAIGPHLFAHVIGGKRVDTPTTSSSSVSPSTESPAPAEAPGP